MLSSIKDTTYEELFQKIPKYPTNWKSEDVGIWLTHIGMQSYIKNFEEMSVDGFLILELTEEDLETELSIIKKLHRKKIVKAIQQLHRYNEFLEREREKESQILLQQSKGEEKIDDLELIREDEITTTNQNQNEDSFNGSDLMDENEMEVMIASYSGSVKEKKIESEEFIIVKSIEGPSDVNYKVKRDGIRIGRHSSNNIVIFEESVSRFHAKIIYQQNSFYLLDIKSTTGTFVKVTERLLLKPGQLIEIGSYQFIINNIHIAEGSTENKLKESYIQLSVIESPDDIEDRDFVLYDNESIGRKSLSTISFSEDLHMSNLHVKINLIQDQFFLEDIASTNGTWLRLSEECVESDPMPLHDKLIFKIGNSAMYEIEYNKPAEIQKEEEKQEEIKESKIDGCSVCWNGEKDCLIMPCRHNVTCSKCIGSLENCPVCEIPIEDHIKIFRS